MIRQYKCALLCAILALSVLQPIAAKRSFGGGRSHSYPKSGGLSGGGHHYPSSGGLSGGGHGYPSQGGSHSYPSQGGSHTYPSQGGSHSYPSQGGSHNYPSSGGLSGSNTHNTGSHGYPAGKVSGNTGGSTNVHYHYHYNPPKQITYAPSHGAAPISYPVYRGAPPTYVYQYKDSGSKYGTLLAGLALLNLGTLAGTAYAVSHSHGHGGGSSYKTQPGEVCKFGIKKDNGDYEETRIDCQLISSFIFAEQAKTQSAANNTTITTTTFTNTTTVNMVNGVPQPAPVNQTVSNPIYEMLPNGTLVPVNVTSTNTTANVTSGTPGNPMTSSVTMVTTTNTTTVNALDVKGSPIAVTPGMTCYVIRHTSSSNMRKSVPCGLLQTYAEKSLKKNSAIRNTPTFMIAAIIVATFVMY